MTVFDRYLIRVFAKVLLICMISITGLYVVIDFCNNMDEFLNSGQQQGQLQVIGEYYGIRVPWFFDRISGLLALIAAMFAITWLQRTNEMTALLAAGIPKSRIVKPLVLGAVAISLLAAANREVVIPGNRNGLLQNAQDLQGEAPRTVEPVRDYRSDILLNGLHTYAREQRIEQPNFRLHQRLGQFGRKLIAENAYYHPPQPGRPGGYLLDKVEQPENLAVLATAQWDGAPVIYSPRDTDWLKPDQCFVVSEVDFQRLAGGTQWQQFASTRELFLGLRNPSHDLGLDARVTIHSRVVQPLLDMTLFFLGIPLVLTRESRNIFVAAGWCLGVVVCFFTVLMLCQALGNHGYLLSPALAAWLPLLLFAPIAAAVSSPIWD